MSIKKAVVSIIFLLTGLSYSAWEVVERDTVSMPFSNTNYLYTAFSKCYNPGGEQFSSMGMNTYPAEGHSPVFTMGEYRYAIYYNIRLRPVIARRHMPDGKWERTCFCQYEDAPVWDLHNISSIGVSPDGYVHTSWGMHSDQIRYRRSVNPWAIDSFTGRILMAGLAESTCSYPYFINAPSGFYFFYREWNQQGYTINRWDESTKSWTMPLGTGCSGVARCPLLMPVWPFNGSGRPYMFRPAFGKDGSLHIAWTQMQPNMVQQSVRYAYSTDSGKTWRDKDGLVYTIPINDNNAKIVSTNISNAHNAMDVDTFGRAHIVSHDNSSLTKAQNLFHIWKDGSNIWHTDTVYTFTGYETMGDLYQHRSEIAVDRQNRVHILTHANRTSKWQQMILTANPPEYKEWTEQILPSEDIATMFQNYDYEYFKKTDTLLKVFQAQCVSDSNNIVWYGGAPEYGSPFVIWKMVWNNSQTYNEVSNKSVNTAMLTSNFNPTNSSALLRVGLSELSKIRLSIYNANGVRLVTLADGIYGQGKHIFNFSTTNLSSGMYVAALLVNGKQTVNKIMVTK